MERFSCQRENNVTVKRYPMFWTWLDYRPGMNFDSGMPGDERHQHGWNNAECTSDDYVTFP